MRVKRIKVLHDEYDFLFVIHFVEFNFEVLPLVKSLTLCILCIVAEFFFDWVVIFKFLKYLLR